MPSFDVVSEIDLQEIDNAYNQAKKEVEARYDFKGSKCEIQWDKKEITLLGEDDYKMDTMISVLQSKIHRRGIDIKCLDIGKREPAGGRMLRQKVLFKQGLDKELSKAVITAVKESKIKVQTSIIDEKVRVTSKNIDDLQETMQVLRGGSFALPLQFTNMRS
jgi:uncharacterized protein YajQ (UPF0234 family)